MSLPETGIDMVDTDGDIDGLMGDGWCILIPSLQTYGTHRNRGMESIFVWGVGRVRLILGARELAA